jgi:localization factor PodJL
MPSSEIAVTIPPPTPPVTVVAPVTEKPAALIPPPPGARRLSNEELREVQAKLQALGHDPGPADGLHGPQTVSAVKRYEIANQLEPTGSVDLRLLERLRREP